MSTFVLVPGAGGAAWYWSRVVPRLAAAGHEAIAVDLPGDDNSSGLAEYAALVVDAIADRSGVVLVAQSLGGFTAPLVCERAHLGGLVFVNAMIPVPGETPGEWWGNTGAVEARDAGGYGEFDPFVYFLHDVPADVVADGEAHQREEADAVFGSRCEFAAWPDVPTRVVVGADDRFFPAAFQQRVARERLRIEPDVIPGGHLLALAQPARLAEYLVQPA